MRCPLTVILIAGFLIGAQATTQADRLLTRDPGVYRRDFTKLEVVDAALDDA
jgi:predicted nucleic acid-binding protein